MSAPAKFSFTISDLARILGKSPVTLRGWERHGLISFPRNGRGDRRFDLASLRGVLDTSVVRERVAEDRIYLAEAAITILGLIENE